MFQNGSLVTLATSKTHGEGEDAVRLTAGICGMIVRGERKSDSNHRYTVDFGSYGAWYCMQNELTGDDVEGWDGDQSQEPYVTLEQIIGQHRAERTIEDIDADEAEEEEAERSINEDRDDLNVDLDRFFQEHPEEKVEDYIVPAIDIEKDIQRRMKEIEKGTCYDSSE